MSTRIQIKRGTTTPTGLTVGEFAYNVTNSTLYIGNTASDKWIGGEVTGGTDMGAGSAASQNRVPTQNSVYQYARNNFVHRLNGITGGITLNAGTNITITSSVAGGITIASSDTVGVTAGDAVTWTQLQRFPAGISAHGATLSGTVTAPTQAVGTNNTTVATTAFVQNEIIADTVTSVNGATGAITNVARTNAGNTFSVVQVFNAGISAAGGVTANTLSVTGTSKFEGTASFNSLGVGISAGTAVISSIRTAEIVTPGNNLTVRTFASPAAASLSLSATDGSFGDYSFKITPETATANRGFTLPNESGTFALRGANTFTDLQTLTAGLSAAGGITFNGTITGATATFSRLVTGNAGFSGALTGTATNASALGGTAAASWALLASPTFTGTPAAPTPTAGTNTTQIATTAFVRTEITNLVDSAPGTLDTLNELAAALGDDPNFATTITTALSNKAGTTGGGASGTWGISITGNAATATTSSQLGGTAASSWALLASPTFTGTPAAPTPAVGTNSTQIATTAFVQNEIVADTVTSFNGRTGAVQGVSAAVAGNGISVSGATGAVTITNTGVTHAVAGTGISVSANTGTVTITNTGVQSFNGLTGAVGGVCAAQANTFTALQTFSGSGISASSIASSSLSVDSIATRPGGVLVRIDGTFETVGQTNVGGFLFASDSPTYDLNYLALHTTELTQGRTVSFQNDSGVVALTKQLMGTVNGSTAATTAVTSFNGRTGAVTGASLGANTFSGLQTSTTGFSGPLTGAVTGNASTATALQTARGFSLSGDVTASVVNFDGTGSVTLNTAIAAGAIVDTDINSGANIAVTKLAANKISGVTLGNNLNTLTIGSGLGGSSYNGSAAVTITNNGVLSFNGSTGAIQGVSSIVAGTNVTISPTGGTGAVTINSVGVTSTAAYTWSSAQTFNGGVTASRIDVTDDLKVAGGTQLSGHVTINRGVTVGSGGGILNAVGGITGATFTATVDVTGAARFNGGATASALNVTGAARFNGGATASTLDVSGTSRFAGTASFTSALLPGISAARIESGEIQVTTISGRGFLTTPTIVSPTITSSNPMEPGGGASIRLRTDDGNLFPTTYYNYTISAPSNVSANQGFTLPTESGTFALRGANTFTGLQTLTAGLSAAGGITLNGAVAGATATFSRLLTANAGISASGITANSGFFGKFGVNSTSAITISSFNSLINIACPTDTIEGGGGQVAIGDPDGAGNSTYIYVDDENFTINLNAAAVVNVYSNLDNYGNANFGLNVNPNNGPSVTGRNGVAIGAGAISAKTSGYTLTAADNGKVITFNSASAVVCGVGTASGATGYSCTVIQLGTGGVRFASSGVTLNSYNGLTLAGQHAAASLVCYQTNILNVSGNLVP